MVQQMQVALLGRALRLRDLVITLATDCSGMEKPSIAMQQLGVQHTRIIVQRLAAGMQKLGRNREALSALQRRHQS